MPLPMYSSCIFTISNHSTDTISEINCISRCACLTKWLFLECVPRTVALHVVALHVVTFSAKLFETLSITQRVSCTRIKFPKHNMFPCTFHSCYKRHTSCTVLWWLQLLQVVLSTESGEVRSLVLFEGDWWGGCLWSILASEQRLITLIHTHCPIIITIVKNSFDSHDILTVSCNLNFFFLNNPCFIYCIYCKMLRPRLIHLLSFIFAKLIKPSCADSCRSLAGLVSTLY